MTINNDTIKRLLEELKKRMPEEPSVVNSDRFGRHWVCPDCGTWLKEVVTEDRDKPSFCRNCGKAIDWEKVMISE